MTRLRLARRSLILRLVGLSLLLLLIVQAAGFAVVRASIDRNARAQIARALDLDENIWRRLLDQNAEQLRQGSALLAADYGFRSAVNSGDEETIQSVLENHGSRIGAAVTALLGTDLTLRAVSLTGSMDQFPATLQQVVPRLAQQPQGSQIAVMEGIPYQFVMVPMRAPVVIGWVLMGFRIDQSRADEMRQLLSVHVALMVKAPGGAMTLPVSTLPKDAQALLLASGGAAGELQTAEGTLLARSSPLDSVGGEVHSLLLRSVDEVVAPYRQLQVLLAIITVAGVLLFAVGTGLVAQRLATPLRSLLAATQRLSRGEYDVPLEHTDRTDEIGNLARSFDHMRVDIGAQQTEIRRLAYWDRLTGLPNRERFRDAVVQAIAASASTPQPLAVLTLDLDRFKHVNDVLGYAFGDRLLQAVAERLSQQVRSPDDMVARLGGNEFAILLQRADAADAHDIAQRINQSFELPLAFEDQTVDLSAGIGFACWPGDAGDADTLLSRSEIAMYAAKRQLSGALQYDAAFDSSSAQTLSLLTELRHAVEHHELRLYLQPKVPLHGQPGLAAEALVRWQHPQRGLVPPMQFIPFAEQTGFVRHLTLWMFEEVARLLADPRTQGLPLRVSVNLSTRDLLDPELSHRLADILVRHGVPASAFCLEITESAIMDDPQRAEAMLNRLSEQGFKLSIDDFGTGYSSLAYLKRLPVDELKIDKSFVMGMETGEDDAMIVRSTIDLAHNLGLTVVAEGVETAAIQDRLRALACDEAQGYHIARPLPVDDFLAWQARQE
ncbi:diguanylate cyclase (GGDEF)-like protein [Acidovorax delafieldii]|uniref:Diguanylate cyclase (GGDEF)-like protein n=1 Tax=Acidovorax delafieldii TaxID=47920 RepID=A0AAJ2BWL9_ACIDE|nr:EAL domain-containing protein [Acidovorax delafieldii]MDR6765597.1 diguanylate cyclase (GGDEF)-like protein [Acidovorax delafieldii]MDR6836034.1 diguanylate cyclase (GGDEF)-like protein [Acidovorax delafieldii]MDR7364995.1 diguanylate cyclase (GGDEF)-like protein [Acidovorax delafieldii]